MMVAKLKIFFLFFLCFVCLGNSSIAQGHTSFNNSSGIWSSPSSWQKSHPWLNDIPGNNGGASINIYGIITANSNLSIANGITMNVYDTLIINGNFVLDGGAILNVQNTGVFIVRGNLTSTGGSRLTTEGRVAVTGNILTTGGGNITNNATGANGLYAFQTVTNNWATMNSGTFHNEEQMSERDFPLYNYAVYGTLTLPVQVLYFRAESRSLYVHLTWATSSEKDFDYFSVERSSDLLEWVNIGEVSGAGNSSDLKSYKFEDQYPLNGRSFYRLKATDIDGSVEYHEVIAVDHLNSTLGTIYPNPIVGNHLFVNSEFDSAKIRIFSMAGIEIYNANLHTGKNDVNISSHLKKGFYIVSLTEGNSEQKFKLKVE